MTEHPGPIRTAEGAAAFLAGLRVAHLHTNGRRSETACGLETAVHLWKLCEAAAQQVGPPSILDLGSGFSSLTLRAWQHYNCPTAEVWTTDTEWRWLGTTLYELEQFGLDTRHCLHHALFHQLPAERTGGRFDLIFHDLNGLPERVRQLPNLTRWLAPNGLLVLDDWHSASYRGDMTAALAGAGFVIDERVEDTRDEFGRFVAHAWLPATPPVWRAKVA